MSAVVTVPRFAIVPEKLCPLLVTVPPNVKAGSVQVAAAVQLPPTLAAVLIVGVVRLGDVPNTSAPDPVSPVTADARFALDGVARKVATPVPSPEIPVDTGRPPQLVSVPLDGVPRDTAADPPRATPSIVPPLISAVVTVPRSAMVPEKLCPLLDTVPPNVYAGSVSVE